MNRKIAIITGFLLLAGGMFSYRTVTAYMDNRHWEKSREAYERYAQSQEELPDPEQDEQEELPETEQKEHSQSDRKQQEITKEEQTDITGGYRITPFRVVDQYPELPTGCEITALTMVLNYYGYHVDKMDMALDYLPKTEAEFYENEAGVLFGPDMERYFVGDPTGDGYICGNTAIETAANRYLRSVNSEYSATALDYVSPEVLYQYIEEDTPVVVWVTINMEEREETDGWYLEDGTYMEWSGNDHGAVLIGYDESTVTLADPIYDIVICSRERFERIFAERGSQCVVLQKNME